ncbi:ferritin-like domain-containing protein [Actinospica durhamensis]|uniref:Ferritin-like domain-containing protein n=1 Tax=Actinospica durhamensis TaxID=1508375 RepID=A0A941IQM9_9ACTN|nr:ferritin-like domain-containing protein [Actinospica durhamensis]MBR7837855.1 ferritin-like domain-containing protein [Actinospica durhamensis]
MDGEAIDTRLLAALTEESQDLNSDAVRLTRSALADFTGEQHEARGRRGAGIISAGLLGLGAVLLGGKRAQAATASTAASPSGNDVMALQTAASIENLAVSVYTTAAGLSFIKSGNPTVAAFIAKTTAQHQDHAAAFNAALSAAGAKTQGGVDPKYEAAVKAALPNIKNAGEVVSLALTLEDVAAQTYTKYVGEVTTMSLRTLFGSVAPVEAQHRSVLLAVQALLNANDADLITIPTDAAKLPAAAGSVGIPVAFYPTANASPTSEGAVS